MDKLTVGSLFSGIGGLELGLEMTDGFETKWQIEIDEYATKVLEKHWPNVPKYRDIRDCGKHNLERTDVLCGGFPCQDISNAGKKAGIKEGTRSGLWSEYYRIICELRPRYVLVENVAALRYRGLGRVLGDLASCGYDAQWEVLPASAFGALHKRERLFIIAYRQSRYMSSKMESTGKRVQAQFGRISDAVPSSYWQTNQPSMVGMVHGVSPQLYRSRVKGIGNAVVPQVAQHVGQCILNHAYLSSSDELSQAA